jgi:hypothetical protein
MILIFFMVFSFLYYGVFMILIYRKYVNKIENRIGRYVVVFLLLLVPFIITWLVGMLTYGRWY